MKSRKQAFSFLTLLLVMVLVVAGCTNPAPPATPETPPMETPAEPVTEKPPVETEEPVMETPAEPVETEEPVIETPAEPVADLPVLEVREQPEGGMGYEALRANDVSEIITGTPWTEDFSAETLPVYQNTALVNEDATPTDELLEIMKQELIDVAARFDVQVNPEAIEVIMDESQQFPNARVSFVNDAYSFETNMLVTTDVKPQPPIDLPPEYTFPGLETKEQLESLADYLKQEHAACIGFDNPVMVISGGDYLNDSGQLYTLGFYEDASDETEALTNFNFKLTNFHLDENGKLFVIRYFNADLSSVIGDYPIITPKEAEELLLAGKYFTTVPEEVPADTIRSVSLVYRNFLSEPIFIPFYRFLVELPNLATGDMKVFGAYYVPAVEEQYISNMP